MDFNYLIKTGQYSEKMLKEEDHSFVEGMRFTVDQVKNFRDDMEREAKDASNSLCERLAAEHAANTVNELLDLLEADVAAEIITRVDSYESDDDLQASEDKEIFDPIKEFGQYVSVLSELEKQFGALAQTYKLTGDTRTIFGQLYVSAKKVDLDSKESEKDYWIPVSHIVVKNTDDEPEKSIMARKEKYK